MDSKFNPPANKEEFLERASKVELKAALALQNALRNRIESATRALRTELEFYQAVIVMHTDGEDAVVWPPKAGDQQ